MTLTLDENTRTRLEQTRETIASEFDQLPRQQVDARFDQIMQTLLSEATFGNYLPILARHDAREALLTNPGLPAEFRTPAP